MAGGGRQPRVTCRILSRSQSVPPALQIQLYVAPPRAKLMGTVVRQATELGIWRITPVLCDYSVARPDGEAVEKNWKAEALAALKQSGNPFLPEIERPCRFADVLPKSPCQGVFGDLQQGGVAAVRQALGGAGPVALWIGPEGGFSDREREALVAQGLLPVRLGQWILRVETAVPAMLGWLSAMAELGTAGSAVNVQNKRA